MTYKPQYIFIENVKGFDVSETRNKLLDCLNEMNFHVQVSHEHMGGLVCVVLTEANF